MLLRTHLTITLFFVLLFIPLVEFKFVFVTLALLATLLPDADIKNSSIGRFKVMRIFQFFVRHRGFFHSLLFMFLILILFLVFYPVGAFAFFIGFFSHVFADSFTREGITFFYPFGKKSKGWVRTGGKTEVSVLVAFVILDILLIIYRTFSW